MTQREEKLRVRIRTAEHDIDAAQARLRSALLAGGNTGPIRCELEDLHRRIHEAATELEALIEAADVARNEQIATLATGIAAGATAEIESKLAALRPPAKTESQIKESEL